MRLAVFASGGGSNVQSILDAVREGRLLARVVVVAADRPCGALGRADAAGVPSVTLAPADFGGPEAYGEALLDVLRAHGADAVALAGFLRHVPPAVVAAFPGRMLNVHPSLLPAFGGAGMYGRRVHAAVLARGCRVSGATVHLVDDGFDTGPIVAQACVPVLDDDTPETLAARVLETEHLIFPEALAALAERLGGNGSWASAIGETPSPSTP